MLRIHKKGNSRLQWDKVKDSGNRAAFTTGSQRDTQEGKGRFDLIPAAVLTRLAQHYENGALKYGDNNWQKGQPLQQYYNSAMRHLLAIGQADMSEDHFAAAIWNIAAMIHHIDAMLDGTLPKELDSFGILDAIADTEATQKLQAYTTPDTWFSTGYTQFRVIASGDIPDDFTLPEYKNPNDITRFKQHVTQKLGDHDDTWKL